jgi:hypothetical protein
VFVWTYHDDPELEARVTAAGARACIHKLRREELLRELDQAGVIRARRSTDARSAA